jgi:putative OPT family oligopeptide transporter
MTIATLLATSSVFLLLGWTGDAGKAGALVVGCVVATAASVAGDMSQDLKAGYLLGATPRRQQVGQLLGVLTSAAFVCLTILLLDRVWGFGTRELPAPQATLMKLVIEGVLDRSLPWVLVGMGVLLALAAEAVRVPSLPFAVGVYLPVSTMVPVFLGGLLRYVAERRAPSTEVAVDRREQGTLFGSGLVGGEGLVGVGIAAAAFMAGGAPAGFGSDWSGPAGPWLALAAFGLLGWIFWRRTTTMVSAARAGAASR